MAHEDKTTGARAKLRRVAALVLRAAAAPHGAVLLLVILVVVLAVATIYEGLNGRAAVQVYVYHSWWFAGLFVLLSGNVAAALLVRFPWSWRQSWFVLTHVGLLILLVGVAQSARSSVDGRLGGAARCGLRPNGAGRTQPVAGASRGRWPGRRRQLRAA